MTTMQKMTATWTGFTGAPGTTTIYFQGASIVGPGVLKTFFDAWAPFIPNTVSVQVNATGELVEPTTGQVTGTWSVAPVAAVVGSAVGGVLVVTQGVQMRLETGSFRRGKHIRGRFFCIPSSSAVLASNGTVASNAISALTAAGNSLVTGSNAQLGVFHRPLKDYSVKPPVIKEQGEFIPASTCTPLSKVAVLRSRRD